LRHFELEVGEPKPWRVGHRHILDNTNPKGKFLGFAHSTFSGKWDWLRAVFARQISEEFPARCLAVYPRGCPAKPFVKSGIGTKAAIATEQQDEINSRRFGASPFFTTTQNIATLAR